MLSRIPAGATTLQNIPPVDPIHIDESFCRAVRVEIHVVEGVDVHSVTLPAHGLGLLMPTGPGHLFGVTERRGTQSDTAIAPFEISLP